MWYGHPPVSKDSFETIAHLQVIQNSWIFINNLYILWIKSKNNQVQTPQHNYISSLFPTFSYAEVPQDLSDYHKFLFLTSYCHSIWSIWWPVQRNCFSSQRTDSIRVYMISYDQIPGSLPPVSQAEEAITYRTHSYGLGRSGGYSNTIPQY